MKINEIIVENTKKGKLRQSVSDALPDLETWDQLDNNNNPYLAYRFGIALAPAPARNSMPVKGPLGSDFITIGYSEADNEILRSAAEAMGVTPTTCTNKGSTELDTVNKSSPVQAKGPVTLKKKSK